MASLSCTEQTQWRTLQGKRKESSGLRSHLNTQRSFIYVWKPWEASHFYWEPNSFFRSLQWCKKVILKELEFDNSNTPTGIFWFLWSLQVCAKSQRYAYFLIRICIEATGARRLIGCFDQNLFHYTKFISSWRLSAFDSPNFPPLATLSGDIRWHYFLHP